jgi:prepilin-type N-terminal cleavage/methylation domain-containing protein
MILRRKSGFSGFTLIELMIAVLISTVITSALFGLFKIQSRQLMHQDQQMSMHQNLRFAADILSRSARMAGYGTGGAVSGPMGFDYSSDSTADDFSLPAIISWDGGSSSADAITLVYADPSLEMNTSVDTTEACSTTSLTFNMAHRNYSNLIGNYAAGELMMCWDYGVSGGTESYLWKISTAGSSSTGTIGVTSNSGSYSDFDALCGTTENLPPILWCSRASVVSFYIDSDDTDGVGPGSSDHPVLMMDLNFSYPSSGPASDDVPLVDEIEDLQIEYCPKSEDCTSENSWVDELALDDNGDYEGNSVWMVRFTIVARSQRTDLKSFIETQGHSESRPAIANRNAGSTSDNYHRTITTTEVTVRNLRLL